jgi:hypothetical protein
MFTFCFLVFFHHMACISPLLDRFLVAEQLYKHRCLCVCVSVCLCVCPRFCPRFFIKLSKPLQRPGGPQVIVLWSKERVGVGDLYSVVQLGPNPFLSERCACAARNLVSTIHFEKYICRQSQIAFMSTLRHKM